MLSVQNNMLAKNASRQLNINTKENSKIAEKLSSGYKINKAADDAAGLAISEKMRRQIRGLNMSAENIKDGIGYVQTAEGALNEVHDMLQRMNELAIKAANGTNTESDRAFIDSEIQALKKELDRVFSTTTFNEQRIWRPDVYGYEYEHTSPSISGYTEKQFVTFTGSAFNFYSITNQNCGAVPADEITINAGLDGVNVSWTGYDGKKYETEKLDWNTLKNNNYTIEIKPKDDSGNVLFDYSFSMSVDDTATVDDIIASINGVKIRYITTLKMSSGFEDSNGNEISNGLTAQFLSSDGNNFNYGAAYASRTGSDKGYSFESSNDRFMEPDLSSGKGNLTKFPSSTTVEAARTDNETWEFAFILEGIGKVTARAAGCTCLSQNVAPTLADIMSALTTGGVGSKSGKIVLEFDLTSDIPFTYGDNISSNWVGRITLTLDVRSDDNEETVLAKITNALNADTILDAHHENSKDDFIVWKPTAKPVQIPEYDGDMIGSVSNIVSIGGMNYFWVQAGAEPGQHIDIAYESLSLRKLNMQDTNVLTVEDADNAINEIKAALQIISDQRSLFGAYQNRLEHAYNINKNVEENTQASESLIRDADIANEMMEYSINNILMQAGTSMLAQANQSRQSVLELLS